MFSGKMVSCLGDGNKYILVTADSNSVHAEEIRQFFTNYLANISGDAKCFTYNNLKNQYNTFTDDSEMLSQFLEHSDADMGFQNIFWLFLLTPDVQSQQPVAQYLDQQIWLRAGKIISLLVLNALPYRNQISFWTQKGISPLEFGQILGEKIREYGEDFEEFSRYIDSAQRRTSQLRSNLKIHTPQNKKAAEIVALNNTENTLINGADNNSAVFEQLANILETQQISYDEIITFLKKENRIVVKATWIVEIPISNENENGGT